MVSKQHVWSFLRVLRVLTDQGAYIAEKSTSSQIKLLAEVLSESIKGNYENLA